MRCFREQLAILRQKTFSLIPCISCVIRSRKLTADARNKLHLKSHNVQLLLLRAKTYHHGWSRHRHGARLPRRLRRRSQVWHGRLGRLFGGLRRLFADAGVRQPRVSAWKRGREPWGLIITWQHHWQCAGMYHLQQSLKDSRFEEFFLEVAPLPKFAPLPLPYATPKTNSSEQESLSDRRTL